jgi:hypothetical protein
VTLRTRATGFGHMFMESPAPRAWRRVTRPSRFWRRVGKRFGIGHRSAFLMVMGGIFMSLGLSILLTSPNPNPLLFHTQIPQLVRVSLWCGSGLLALAFARDFKWQWVGFAALGVPPVERLFSYLSGIIRDALFGDGLPLPWPFLNQAFLYFMILFITRLVSSWPDPPSDEPLT